MQQESVSNPTKWTAEVGVTGTAGCCRGKRDVPRIDNARASWPWNSYTTMVFGILASESSNYIIPTYKNLKNSTV